MFVDESPESAHTKVVIVDKDFTEISAIKAAFSSSPAIQLCQFHVAKAFRTAASNFSKSAEERNHLIACFPDLVHVPTSNRFQECTNHVTAGETAGQLTLVRVGRLPGEYPLPQQ